MAENRSGYRAVPASDKGVGYSDKGMLGTYQTNDGEPWAPPVGVDYMPGYGADEADLKRGWVTADISENPAYDLQNYKERSSAPRVPDDEPGEANPMADDWAFRDRNRRAQGFLTRPRIPTERN